MLRSLLPHLPCFSMVASHLSFTLAAESLAISQSAVSYQIQQLENKLGFSVLCRRKGGQVELTERGRLLLQEYRLMETNLSRVVSSLSPHAGRTQIKITAPVDFGCQLLVPVLDSIEQAGLVVDLHLSDKTVLLRESDYDLAIRSDQSEDNISYEPLLSCSNVLVCGANYPINEQLALSSLAKERLLLRNRSNSRSWSSLLTDAGQGLDGLNHVRVLNNSFALLEAVKQNMGISLLPEYMVIDLIKGGQLRRIELEGAHIPTTPFYIAYENSVVTRRWASLIAKALTS